LPAVRQRIRVDDLIDLRLTLDVNGQKYRGRHGEPIGAKRTIHHGIVVYRRLVCNDALTIDSERPQPSGKVEQKRR
jgi:hypothetical protein